MAIAIDSVSDTSTRENSTILHRLHAMQILHIIFYSVVINLLKIIFPIWFYNDYFPRNWIMRTLTSGSSCWWWWPRRRRPRRDWAPAPQSPWRWRTSTTTVPSLTWIPTPRPSLKTQSQVIQILIVIVAPGWIVKYFWIINWKYSPVFLILSTDEVGGVKDSELSW